jgi:hypothetical protein
MGSTDRRFANANLSAEQRCILESFYAGQLSAGQLIRALQRAEAPMRRAPDLRPRSGRAAAWRSRPGKRLMERPTFRLTRSLKRSTNQALDYHRGIENLS